MRVLETGAVNGARGQAGLAAFRNWSLLVLLTAVANGTIPNSGSQNEITLSLSMTHTASAGMVDFSAPSKYGWCL